MIIILIIVINIIIISVVQTTHFNQPFTMMKVFFMCYAFF